MKSNIKAIKYIAFFLLLMYPFNFTLSYKLYPNNIVVILSIILGIFLLVLTSNFKKVSKYQVIIIICTLISILFIYTNNYYYVEGRFLYVIIYLVYMLLPLVLSSSDKETSLIFEKVLTIFLLEHIIFTLFIQFFKGVYANGILPWMLKGVSDTALRWNLYFWLNMGYNAGFTTHYSTNAIYLSIATIFYFCKCITNNDKTTNNKKNRIFFVLSFISLLLTAKRAHLLFSVLTCIVVYVFNNKEKINKKILKLFSAGLVGIVVIVVTAMFIPEVTNVFNRFLNGDMYNGREKFYAACFDNFKKRPLLGNGWGYFSYFYEKNIRTSYDYHFLDAHNVFYQLLCEVGIIGFVFFGLIMLLNMFNSKKMYKKENNIIYSFSFAYQIFFILYCLSGNPLYDIQCFSLYFILTGLTFRKEKL